MNRKIYQTIKSYNIYAEEYSNNIANLAPLEKINEFSTLIAPQAEIIELGCGSGRDSMIFIEKGFKVTGIDLADNLLKIAKANVPKAFFCKMDIRELDFENDQFHGVWASACLLHLPKNEMPETLQNIKRILKNNGVLYLSLKEGIGEKYEPDLRYGSDAFKFWSYFSLAESKLLLENAGFEIIKAEINQTNSSYTTNPWIDIICKK